MLLTISYIAIACTGAFLFLVVFSSRPYPKELEDEENKELKKKFDEYKEKSQE
jgi:hypothetical protein